MLDGDEELGSEPQVERDVNEGDDVQGRLVVRAASREGELLVHAAQVELLYDIGQELCVCVLETAMCVGWMKE
jgi:hypothetical protein